MKSAVSPMCVVFADAFAYGSYINLANSLDGYSVKKLIPGIAYSSNLHYTLFEGKTPDDVGFFTDYMWTDARTGTHTGSFHRKCDEIVTLNNVYRYIRRKISKKTDNIFFSEMDYFVKQGKYKFMQEEPCYVFGELCDKAYEKTTEASFQKAHDYLENGSRNIVIVLEELDHVGHDVGIHGEKYKNAAEKIVSRTNLLFKEFCKKHNDGFCILVSDHGMADVKATVDILNGLKKRFGLPGEKYQVYNDSVYMRIWSDDTLLLNQIEEFLDSIDLLIKISIQERKKLDVMNRGAGDVIYRMREGYAFEPNCFGVSLKGGVMGLHGYMEPSEEASGVVVTNRLITNAKDIKAVQLFQTIYNCLHSK